MSGIVITRTPFRVSFFGGGSDYPAWYRREGGAVLSTAIDKYSYLYCRYAPAFFKSTHRVVWRHIEQVNAIGEILHPAVREGLKWLGFDNSRGVEIYYQGDVPARSGMGSSSAFAVGLIKGLLALKGQEIGAHELALKAIELEQDVLREAVGSQDQMAAAHGGLNVFRFATDGAITAEPVVLSDERRRDLESRLMLVFTGQDRLSSDVAESVIANLADREAVVRRMRDRVGPATEILRTGDLDDFGRLLDEAWQDKRSLSDRVSTAAIDAVYTSALLAGALGGKLLGAGAAGFMLLYVPPERRSAVRQALRHFQAVSFRLEPAGCTVIYRADDVGGPAD
jgi:D-glycero-alpha-D-manno-heptose-7-phosphate kinase